MSKYITTDVTITNSGESTRLVEAMNGFYYSDPAWQAIRATIHNLKDNEEVIVSVKHLSYHPICYGDIRGWRIARKVQD